MMVMRWLGKLAFSRFGIVIMILLAVGLVLVFVEQRVSGPMRHDDQVTGSDAEQSNESAPNEPMDDGDVVFEETTDPELSPEAVDFAMEFVEAYLDVEGKRQDVWLQELEPFLTEYIHESLETVDLEAVPADDVQGDPIINEDQVDVELGEGTIHLTVSEDEEAYGKSPVIVELDWTPA
ncbi:hypothetical protein [Haloglycomyces albus]|uniref:hypothetical protein n=1 Tax=Haloglycomyces albus TaxID=526067 RepID=UPI00046D7485|nr:hypothetical protein [Haloglycomyces albus]